MVARVYICKKKSKHGTLLIFVSKRNRTFFPWLLVKRVGRRSQPTRASRLSNDARLPATTLQIRTQKIFSKFGGYSHSRSGRASRFVPVVLVTSFQGRRVISRKKFLCGGAVFISRTTSPNWPPHVPLLRTRSPASYYL
jgi:hypothetical protein